MAQQDPMNLLPTSSRYAWEEGIIPLAGAGFVAKKNGNFRSGEYKRLCNVENKNDLLVNRRNVYSVHGENTGSTIAALPNVQRFLGNMGEYSLLTNGAKQWLVGNSTFKEIWNSLAAGPSAGSSFSRMVGFFRYNNKNCWLVLEFNVGVTIGMSLYYDTGIPVPDVPETYVAGYEASLTRTVLFTFAVGTNDFYDFQFKNFFIYKERLWIATSVGLYFSAATAPTNFTAPSGGFFKHPGNTVNYAFGIKDTIYTLCEDAVYALTYSTDPNLDATERPLSDVIGGEMGVIHLDTPYFINNLGIFAIRGNNVDKVMDSRFDYGKDVYANHLFSFEEYLVVNKFTPINYDNNYSPPNRVSLRTNYWTNPESDAVGGTQIATGWTKANSPVKVRTNKIPNPTFGAEPVSTNTWFVSQILGVDFGRSGAVFRTSAHSGYVNRQSGAGTADIGMHSIFIPATAGLDYYISGYVQPEVYYNVEVRVYWYNGAAALSSQALTVYCAGDVWTRIGRKVTAPATATQCFVRFTFKDVDGVERQYVDDVLFEQCTDLRDYFDGGTVDDALKVYAWTGVANESTSTATLETCVANAVTTIADGQPGKVLALGGTVGDTDFIGPLVVDGDCWATWSYTLNPVAAIVVGAPYTFTCDHRAVGAWADGILSVTVDFLDAGAASLGTTTVDIDDDYDVTAGYQNLTITNLVPPANTDAFKFTFKLVVLPTDTVTTWAVYQNRFSVERSTTYSGYFNGDTTDTVAVTYVWTGVAFASTSTASSDTHGYLRNNGGKFEPYLEGNSLGYNTYFVNTENGSTHVLDFMDQYVNASHGSAGYVVDAVTNPFKDSSGNYKWLFLTNKSISEGVGGLNYNGYVYFISSSEDTEVNDYAIDTAGVLKRRPPKIDIEIDSFVPDGYEYRNKKFRSLMIQGIMPPAGMELQTAYDNSAFVQTTTLGDDESALSVPRRHYAHRLGLNQRARSITIRLLNPAWLTAITAAYGFFEVSDIRTRWSPTERLPGTKNIGS